MMSLKNEARVGMLVVAVMVGMLLSVMVVMVEAHSHPGRGKHRHRTSTSAPLSVVSNTTRYGSSNVCKVCTTTTFRCDYHYRKHCPVNYTTGDNKDKGHNRGKRHVDKDDPHHHHHHGWNEWSSGGHGKKKGNGTSKLIAVMPGRQWCTYNVSKTCTESKCEIRCCDGSTRDPGTNACKARRGSDGKMDGCMNGGTLNKRKTYCSCPQGFMGIQCEHRKCAKACQNGGQCKTNTTRTSGRLSDTNHNDDYCLCPSGTAGDFCETKKCSKECENNGTCIAVNRWWTTCACQPGFKGQRCEKKDREGACPAMNDIGDGPCLWYMGKYECSHDEDCEGNKKCCRGNCYRSKCVDPVQPNVTCTYNNETYDIGSIFSPDACRLCTCNETHTGLLQGTIECTRLMCPQLPSGCKNITTPPDSCCPVCHDDKSSNLCGDKYEDPYFVNCPKEEVVFDVEPGSNVAKVNMTLIAKDCEGKRLNVLLSDDRFRAGVGDENYHLLSAASDFDGRGNFAECVFHIRVRDTEPPKFITCPMNFVESADLPASWPLPVARDNVGLKTSPTSARHPGQHLPPGDYIIDYWAEDFEGNVARCSFTVTVVHSHKMHKPTEHPHPHPHPHPLPHPRHQGQSSPRQAAPSGSSSVKAGLGIAAVLFAGVLVFLGVLLYRRYRRVQGASTAAGGPTVRMSSVTGSAWGGGHMDNLPPRYGASGEEIMPPPLPPPGYQHDMMASGGGVPEAGELPSKSPLP